MNVTVFLVVILGAALVLWFSYRRMLKRKEQRFEGRKDLTAEEFYASYYAGSGLPQRLVVSVLKDVATRTEVPLTKVRPQDRFGVELSPVKGWEYDDGLGILSEDLSARLLKHGINVDLSKVRTLDEYIKLLVPLLQKEEVAPA